MSFVKAYFKPGEGYKLYMPDGTPITGLKQTTINDEWIEASSRAGKSGFKAGTPTAIQELFVEVVNEEPTKSIQSLNEDEINNSIQWGEIRDESFNSGKVSDGYHTFDELYAHRISLFKALCIQLMNGSSLINVWKSKIHSDGWIMEGWFIAGIGVEAGKQITYHIPITEWDTWPGDEMNAAPVWDGHTSADVLERLAKL